MPFPNGRQRKIKINGALTAPTYAGLAYFSSPPIQSCPGTSRKRAGAFLYRAYWKDASAPHNGIYKLGGKRRLVSRVTFCPVDWCSGSHCALRAGITFNQQMFQTWSTSNDHDQLV
jgi:hypothetical protein